MSVNIGNNEAEQFSNYRKTIDGTDEKGKTEGSSYEVPEDITSDDDDDVVDTDNPDTEAEDEIEEEEFKEEINHNFPLSGGGTPLDV
ncbi:hypothetical protein CJD36_015035 [Flavipsychrobacter stenotrophus]|uniref:Uncharacterized protein n=1 Tax=Flavipsychrobacter stenotrophus TaxID=2077091 RepID=A0A2S7STR5_9BACT|nr:hypothetical protein [Flavipsychrobacter stenotrophus]PQJ10011.1 hypothetical protein CJD36_015035 [Flavipsychrobacter stenotrophus]